MMKKLFITMALFAVLAGVAVSCQKGNFFEPQPTVAENGAEYTMQYTVNGVLHFATIKNDDEEQALMQYLLSLVREGDDVVLYDEDACSHSMPKKDTQVLSTTSEADAASWAAQKARKGYKVTLAFDRGNGQYVCIAVM